MKKFFIGVPKVFFAIICYLSALLLAVLSAYFTIIFYADSQTGWNMWAMGGLAGMLEFIKIMLATALPFIQYRDIKREKKVSFYLKICFVLSVMASLNFFLTGGEIERSPASNITALIYTYMPVFEIIPLKFAQFITTMSLSILVEAFIIFLPILAPIMFLEKDKSRKNQKDDEKTNFEKIKEIIIAIPERTIDKLHLKIVGPVEKNQNEQIEVTENREEIEEPKKIENKNNFKLLNFDGDKTKDKELVNKNDSEKGNNSNPDDDKKVNNEEIEKVKEVIEKYRNCEVAPSVAKIMEMTGFSRDKVRYCKQELQNSGYITTEITKTYIEKYRLNDDNEQEDVLNE